MTAMTHRPSEGEVKLQSDGFVEGEGVQAEGVTRYVAKATGALGGDIRLILLQAEPEECRAGLRAGWILFFPDPASSATPTVH